MRLERSRFLDALCGEYLLGTLRGAARRRFERVLRREPLVALRLRHWQALFAVEYSTAIAIEPPRAVWTKLERELELARYRAPWHRRLGLWRGLAGAATAALALVIAVQFLRPGVETQPSVQIAQLEGKTGPQVSAALSRDGRVLELRAVRPVIAGPAQSYELWVIPAEGGAPISLAVLGSLDARFALPAAHAGRVRSGAKLAVTVEPAGGSPTGAATGPVILVGAVTL